MSLTTLLLLHVASTWGMVGLIWLVQLVQYPQFGLIAAQDFPLVHAHHSHRITWIVLPLMGVELVTAGVLFRSPPPWVPAGETALGLLLVLGLWVSTGLLQVPLHERLSHGLDPLLQRSLVRGNWIRTFLWSLRGLLVLGWLRAPLDAALAA